MSESELCVGNRRSSKTTRTVEMRACHAQRAHELNEAMEFAVLARASP